ncbi:MAG: hypothetical protein IPL86_07560 [Flavobacteriales bacterium]|nr:hypothetical protein [Flavobacteriales bacterium]
MKSAEVRRTAHGDLGREVFAGAPCNQLARSCTFFTVGGNAFTTEASQDLSTVRLHGFNADGMVKLVPPTATRAFQTPVVHRAAWHNGTPSAVNAIGANSLPLRQAPLRIGKLESHGMFFGNGMRGCCSMKVRKEESPVLTSAFAVEEPFQSLVHTFTLHRIRLR